MKCVPLALFVFMAASACGRASQSPEIDLDSLLESASASEIRTDMNVLAADEMQGREAATAGHQKAAEYVAHRFAEIGLQSLGDSGTFFQSIDFLESQIAPGSASMSLHRGDINEHLEEGLDFARSAGFGDSLEMITAPLVFVGFGIQAPQYDHDDFSDVDVAGKILVVLSGAPPGFSNNERAFYSSGSGKQALAVRLGAIGILALRTPVDQKRVPWERITGAAKSSEMRWLESGGVPHEAHPQLVGSASLSEIGASKLFDIAGHDLGAVMQRHVDGATGSFELGMSASLRRKSILRNVSSSNVLALLEGSDPNLSDEYVVITAHLDHLGVRVDNVGDDIYNGAYDNAAGVAIVLAIAQALSETMPSPRRSVIFAAVTAEEKGLRGSDFLANNPPVPIECIVANINIDMPFLGFPISDIQGFGVEHSTLEETLTSVAAELGLVVTPDPRPELVRLIRSDQFSFVKQGIPGMNLKPGTTSSSTTIDGIALVNAFLHDNYHEPSDDSNLAFSEEGALLFARAAVLLSLSVANDVQPPQWKEGDFFGDRFHRDSSSDNE